MEYKLGQFYNLQAWYIYACTTFIFTLSISIIRGVTPIFPTNRFIFLCERWLAVDDDDGLVERIIPVCGQEHLMSFNKMFSQHAQRNITDNHLWLSIVLRPQRSNFTRVQRLISLTAFLFLTMLTNAMFFKSSEDEEIADEVKIGFMRFSLTNLFTSIQSIAITTPPIVFVILIYRKSRQRLTFKGSEKLKDFIEQDGKSETVASADDAITRSRRPLPHWAIYIAWVVNTLAILGSTFYLFLISMQWGKGKSEEWLTTFLLSFMESFFVMDPLKVPFLI
jgi:polycystin 1L2